MTLQQVDDVLKTWRERLSAVAENLLELQSDFTYQSLTGTGGLEQVKVTGATATRVGAALRTMNELFLRFGLLQSTVDRAEALRGGLPAMFGADQKARELQQLLFGTSIELQASEVPLAERHLLSGARTARLVSPEELLASMTHAFAEVRDAVADVGRAWTQFAVCHERVESEIVRLRFQAVMPSRLLAPMLDEVERLLADIREHMRSDPVSALVSLHAQVEPRLANANQRVAASEQMKQALKAARSRFQSVERLHGEAAAVVAEVEARLSPASQAQPVAARKLQAIGEWLDRLERRYDDGALEPIAVGLRNWTAAAEICLLQDQAVLSAGEAHLASRNELRGRLDALKAKARAYGLSDVGEIASLCGSAEDLLHARPLDLHLASHAVSQYEHRLRAARSSCEQARSLGLR